MALPSVSGGAYPVRQLLILIIFFRCCAANNKKMGAVHRRKEFLLYATIEIAAET